MVESTDSEGGYELRHYLRVLWRRKLSILGPMIALAIVGWLLGAGLTQSHASSATVIAKPIETGQTVLTGSGRDDTAVGDEIAYLSSDRIRAAVADAVGHEVKVEIGQETTDSNVLLLTVTGAEEDVQRDAQAYADTYIEIRRAELASGATTATEALTERLALVDADLAELGPLIAALDEQIVVEADEVALRGLSAQREDLRAQREDLSLRRSDIESQLADLQLTIDVNPTLGIELLSNATEPELVEGATRMQYASAGLALGLILGVLLAFAREHFDRSVRTAHDVELTGMGVRVLGAVPRHPRGASL